MVGTAILNYALFYDLYVDDSILRLFDRSEVILTSSNSDEPVSSRK